MYTIVRRKVVKNNSFQLGGQLAQVRGFVSFNGAISVVTDATESSFSREEDALTACESYTTIKLH